MKLEIKDINARIIFVKNKQKEIIEKAKENSNLTWKEISKKLRISEISLRNDLRNEKYSISYDNFLKICKLGRIDPQWYTKFILEIKDRNWGRIKGGQIGGRKKKPNISKIKIIIPEVSENLAEFVGILLGDGSICKINYCIEISLNKESDRLYINYVNNLIFNLFGINPKKIFVKGKKLIKLRVNSKNLFNFLKELKLPVGQASKSIPHWIIQDKKLLYSTLRGLFDTDGSLYFSSRRCIMNFSCYSPKMRKQIYQSLNELEIPVSMIKNNINISSLWKIKKFLAIIGTSNTKNIIKFLEYTNNKKIVRTDDLNNFFEPYKSISLPFMGKSSSLV